MQRHNKQTLSISEYARLRGLNKSTISRQVRSGQIPTRDGRIDPVEADRARERNLDPAKRIGNEVRKGAPTPPKQAKAAIEASGPTADEILAGIGRWINRLPELFRAMGAPLSVALLSMDAIEALLYFGLGDMVDCDAPLPAHDLGFIAGRVGIPESELQAILDDPAVEAWQAALSRFFEGEPDCAAGLEPLG